MCKDFLSNLLYRETDDCTAKPIFVVFKKQTNVSDSNTQKIDLIDPPEEFEIDISSDTINVRKLVEEDNIEEIENHLEKNGFKSYNFENETIYYWLEEDEIQCDIIDKAFWTREEANEYCLIKNGGKCKNSPYYSYSIKAEGVLEKVMDFTCKREIERRILREQKE